VSMYDCTLYQMDFIENQNIFPFPRISFFIAHNFTMANL